MRFFGGDFSRRGRLGCREPPLRTTLVLCALAAPARRHRGRNHGLLVTHSVTHGGAAKLRRHSPRKEGKCAFYVYFIHSPTFRMLSLSTCQMIVNCKCTSSRWAQPGVKLLFFEAEARVHLKSCRESHRNLQKSS